MQAGVGRPRPERVTDLYMWSAIDSGRRTPTLTHPVRLLVCAGIYVSHRWGSGLLISCPARRPRFGKASTNLELLDRVEEAEHARVRGAGDCCSGVTHTGRVVDLRAGREGEARSGRRVR